MGKSDNKPKRQKSEKSIRSWKNNKKKTFSSQYRKTKEKIKKAQKTSLSKSDLLILLQKVPNFLGCFAADSIKFPAIHQYPAFLIINLDVSIQPGSHWLALRLGKYTLEIFDSLGFNPSLWDCYPTHLFKFISSYSLSHKFYFSPVLQPKNTFTCGLFAVFFVVYRQKYCFNQCVSTFYKNLSLNNCKLFSLLLKY